MNEAIALFFDNGLNFEQKGGRIGMLLGDKVGATPVSYLMQMLVCRLRYFGLQYFVVEWESLS